nr:immunoglobulin light chain junction region [Macaca mulatta]MOW30875.1 immunoglobulin light chain junction region [Macaca mulatta]
DYYCISYAGSNTWIF